MCTVLFDKFSEIHRQFALVRQTFEEMTGIVIKNPQRVGGYGNFSTQNIFVKNQRLYVGEAAGLQDLLWGLEFGLPCAPVLSSPVSYGGQGLHPGGVRLFSDSARAAVVNRAIWNIWVIPATKCF